MALHDSSPCRGIKLYDHPSSEKATEEEGHAELALTQRHSRQPPSKARFLLGLWISYTRYQRMRAHSMVIDLWNLRAQTSSEFRDPRPAPLLAKPSSSFAPLLAWSPAPTLHSPQGKREPLPVNGLAPLPAWSAHDRGKYPNRVSRSKGLRMPHYLFQRHIARHIFKWPVWAIPTNR